MKQSYINIWKYGWDPYLMLGSDVHGKVIGILGLGKIGSAVKQGWGVTWT